MKILGFAVGLLALCSCATPALAQQPAPPSSVETKDVTWAKHPGLDLLASIYRDPKAPKTPQPVLIDIHGGAWGSGDRTNDRLYATELAKTGLTVISFDFRQAPAYQHPASSMDVAAAVRYVRLNAKSLNADPDRIGLIGSSSGGHLALLAALRPDAPQHKGTPILGPDGAYSAHDDISAEVDYVVAMWPVSDPAARYRYARRASMPRLPEMSLNYFKDEAGMWDASIPRIVTAGEAKTLPPILVVQPGDDSNIPQDMTFDLMRAWQARGGKLDYVFYPGQPHAFGHRPSEATTDLIRTIAAFIARQKG
ncbi:MAG TPA: alpha/beta hydrolase [Hyphomonadaceae bacterium]